MTTILLFAAAVYETFFGPIKAPEIPAREFSVAYYGAMSDGVTKNTAAIRAGRSMRRLSGRPVRHDPSLTVFVSDVHAKRGEHTLGRFERVVGLILSAWPEYRRRTLVRDRSVFKRWLCFPSTGSWGDIGFVAMRTEPGRARAELVLLEHFYPNPNQRSWLDEEIVAEKRCCACTFRW